MAAVMLAAGRSRRFGRRNKLLTSLWGRPLWWWALAAVLASKAQSVVVVVGPRPRQMRRSLDAFCRTQRRSLPIRVVVNPHPGRGLSTSVQAGLAALPANLDAAMICLADMPQVDRTLIDALIQARQVGDAAVIPRSDGRRGNPVLLGRALFVDAARLRGDQGFRPLLADAAPLRFVEVSGEAFGDVDTRRDPRRPRGRCRQPPQMRRPRHPL